MLNEKVNIVALCYTQQYKLQFDPTLKLQAWILVDWPSAVTQLATAGSTL